ncbi:MAG: redoxin domain-containing protein [Bacteroidales bacterium]|jgi:thiol-disulfide isomerase/thioredoxin|nr:redoxin domain-containing protein [Bacteroidales bacterium]
MKVLKFLFISIIIASTNYIYSQEIPSITINLKHDKNKDSVLYLCYTYGDKLFLLDSAEFKNNKYIFRYDKMYPSGVYYIFNQNKNKIFDFLIDNNYKDFEIIADVKNLPSSLSAKNSKINSDYFDYKRFIALKQNEINPYIQKLALEERESETYNQIIREINLINEQVYNHIRNIAAENQDNILGLILLANLPIESVKAEDSSLSEEEVYLMYLDNFFENFKVEDERLLRTPIFQEKINIFLDRMTIQNPKYIIISVDKLIERVINSEEVLKYLLWHVTAKYEELLHKNIGYDSVFVHIIDKYYVQGVDTWSSKSLVDALIGKANEMRTTLTGEKVPDIKLLDKDKRPINLYSIDNPFTLIYFWTDDCANCKKVTTDLLKVYRDFKDEYGLEIFGVYAGNTFDKMLEYINTNSIPWANAYLHSNQDIDYVYLFDIHSTPYLLLLDFDKKVIAKRFIPEDLESLLQRNSKQ